MVFSHLLLAFWCLAGTALSAHAQNYAIDWFTVAGGGGTSTGDAYEVTGTIGQAGAGPTMIGGNYALDGGFWSLIAAVQTPGAPLLTVTLTPTNTAIVSWYWRATGFVLQQNSNATTTNWVDAGGTVHDDGTTKSVVVPVAPGKKFYRLRK